MASKSGHVALPLTGDIVFLAGALGVESLAGAFVKEIQSDGTVVLQGSDDSESTLELSDIVGSGVIVEDPTSPVDATADNTDRLLLRGGRIYWNRPVHHDGKTVTWRQFAASDLPSGYTWEGAHQLNPSAASLADDAVFYSIPAQRFIRKITFNGRAREVAYNLPGWVGAARDEDDADRRATSTDSVSYWGGTVYHVDTYTPVGADTHEWALYEEDLVASINEHLAAIRQLPDYPAAGSRNDKIPKFNGDSLAWEDDTVAYDDTNLTRRMTGVEARTADMHVFANPGWATATAEQGQVVEHASGGLSPTQLAALTGWSASVTVARTGHLYARTAVDGDLSDVRFISDGVHQHWPFIADWWTRLGDEGNYTYWRMTPIAFADLIVGDIGTMQHHGFDASTRFTGVLDLAGLDDDLTATERANVREKISTPGSNDTERRLDALERQAADARAKLSYIEAAEHTAWGDDIDDVTQAAFAVLEDADYNHEIYDPIVVYTATFTAPSDGSYFLLARLAGGTDAHTRRIRLTPQGGDEREFGRSLIFITGHGSYDYYAVSAPEGGQGNNPLTANDQLAFQAATTVSDYVWEGGVEQDSASATSRLVATRASADINNYSFTLEDTEDVVALEADDQWITLWLPTLADGTSQTFDWDGTSGAERVVVARSGRTLTLSGSANIASLSIHAITLRAPAVEQPTQQQTSPTGGSRQAIYWSYPLTTAPAPDAGDFAATQYIGGQFVNVPVGWLDTPVANPGSDRSAYRAILSGNVNDNTVAADVMGATEFTAAYSGDGLTNWASSYNAAMHGYARFRGPDGRWGPALSIGRHAVQWHPVLVVQDDFDAAQNADPSPAVDLSHWRELRWRAVAFALDGTTVMTVRTSNAISADSIVLAANDATVHTGTTSFLLALDDYDNAFSLSDNSFVNPNFWHQGLTVTGIFKRADGAAVDSRVLSRVSFNARGGSSTHQFGLYLEAR